MYVLMVILLEIESRLHDTELLTNAAQSEHLTSIRVMTV